MSNDFRIIKNTFCIFLNVGDEGDRASRKLQYLQTFGRVLRVPIFQTPSL